MKLKAINFNPEDSVARNRVVVDKVPHGGIMKIEIEVEVGPIEIVQGGYSFLANLKSSKIITHLSTGEEEMLNELLQPSKKINRFTGLELSDEDSVN